MLNECKEVVARNAGFTIVLAATVTGALARSGSCVGVFDPPSPQLKYA